MLDEEDLPEEHLNSFEYYFYLSNGSVGTILNLIVLFIAFRHADTHDKPRQIIVINMTIADLLTCVVYMLTRSKLNRFPAFLCYPYYICIFTCQICSCVNLLWLNVDKLIYIKFPLHYYQLVRRERLLVLTFFTWTFFIILGLVAYYNMVVKQACNAIFINPFIYLSIIIIYVLVITLSFAISAVIYCIAHNFRRNEPQAQSRIFQRLFFLFSSTLWTFVTCLPYRILYLLSPLFPSCFQLNENDKLPLFCQLTSYFYLIIVIGIVVNPLITIITQRMYRQQLMKYIRTICSFVKQFLPVGCLLCCSSGDGRSIVDKNGTLTTTTPTAENSSPRVIKSSRLLANRYSSSNSNNSNKFVPEEARLTTISEC
ncbi:hypothetical protein M3Y97_00892200 [Aphelenchoides bicaudatus]|nr:hypothetical protein M3Y97_00892200 [Aphelenchoides bicaudatus]